MKKILITLLCLWSTPTLWGQDFSNSSFPDTWANWERRLTKSFDEFSPKTLPGQTQGILVPSDPRHDILPLTAYAYEVLRLSKSGSVIILLPAPDDYPLNGLAMPGFDILDTSFGKFHVDVYLRDSFQDIDFPIFIDNTPFEPNLPEILQTQLAAIKYFMKGKLASLNFLPIFVKLQDPNSQAKDLGPFLAEKITEMGLDETIKFVICSNLTLSNSETKLVSVDSDLLRALQNLDIDEIVRLDEIAQQPDSQYTIPDRDVLALGSLTLRWLGADHAETLAYTHSSQLILTKNKNIIQSYSSMGFASEPPFPPKIPHIDREHLVRIFDELFRSDILTMVRQAATAILDPTAAKPPTLLQKQAGKKWPVYVSIYDDKGNLAGEKGNHIGRIPLEESLRRYTFKAVQAAKPTLTKDNFQGYIMEVSIPYGFSPVNSADDLIPLLNGIVVHKKRKTYAFHPNMWRTYSNPHQLLGAICFQIGLKPWDYMTRKAKIESFRVMSFNEKEPFQDLGASKRKKKKKKKNEFDDDLGGDADFGGGDGGGLFPF